MTTRVAHILALFAVAVSCLLGGERATLCLTHDGGWELHPLAPLAEHPQNACASTAPADSGDRLACGSGDCHDVEVRGVPTRPAPTRTDAELVALPIHAVPPPPALPASAAGVTLIGRTWSALHAPPPLAVAERLGVRQI